MFVSIVNILTYKKIYDYFLENGISNKKPKTSVTNPGIINRKAAIAIDAPENNS